MQRRSREFIDLHIHVGGAVAPHVPWSIANQCLAWAREASFLAA